MQEWWLSYLEPDGLLLRDRVLAMEDPDRLLIALRSGRLRRVQRGIYLPRTIDYTPERAARASVLSSGISEAVASHDTAARVHGIDSSERARCEHVTVPVEKRRKDRKDLKFHTRALSLGDVLSVGGIPITSIPRTLADLACSLDRLQAVWAIDDALRRALCTREQFGSQLRTWRGGSGCHLARVRLGEADGRSESVLETAGRLALLDRGVPLPEPQYEVRLPDGSVARLDGGYPSLKVGLEFDGQTVHEAPAAVLRDRDRQNGLVALGWTILRFTWWDVTHDPGRFVTTVARVLSGRGGLRSS
jgi:hypothetical protein